VLSKNALLNRPRWRPKKHLLFADSQIPPAIVNAKTKPLSQELTKLTKRKRQFPGGVGAGAPDGPPGGEEEEEGGMVTGTVKQWLIRMIKGSPSPTKPQIIPLGPVKKGKASTSKIPVRRATPSTCRGDDSGLGARLEAIRERCKTLEKQYAASTWGKGKGKGRGPGLVKGKSAREVKQLKPLPGWEDWAGDKKLRRRLAYDDSD